MDPTSGAPMGTRTLRGLAAAHPVEVVTAADGTPHAVIAHERRRGVVTIRDSWRVQDRWWTDEPVDRSYFEIVLEPGRPMLIFREGTDGWFAHA